MKTIISLVWVLILVCSVNKAQDTLYIYKSGSIWFQCPVNKIDSIVFYNKVSQTCYELTKCMDPWPKADNDSILISNVKSFLFTKNIQVISLSISRDGVFELCKSCGCTTGLRVKAVINSNDLIKIQKLRFYECK